MRGRIRSTCITVVALCGCLAPVAAAQDAAAEKPAAERAGGREYGAPDPMATPTVPGAVAQVVDGIAYAPADAPQAVKELIWAANEIVGSPYFYGGGHGPEFVDERGYDCSGTISYALHGADLLGAPRSSSGFFRYGAKGPGEWVSIYTRSSHAYLTVAGIRLDTSAAGDPSGLKGPRWRPLTRNARGFKVRHPVGL